VPRTPAERWWAVGVALTAGITEEAVFRGLLIAVGTQLYGLPLAVAVAASLALFVAGHAYQGRRGMVGVAVLGGLFTMVYLMSGSLLLAMVLHVCQDLLALLLIPAHPSAPRA
jgi:membrane protease YdiL (CAAX protease family)